MQGDVEKVRRWVEGAQRVVVLTGAGISTDSGIPDFRGPQGVWTKNPLARSSPTSITTCGPRGAQGVVEVGWNTRRGREAEPGASRACLLEKPAADALITQDIDELHQMAGNFRRARYRGARHHAQGRLHELRHDRADAEGPRPGVGGRGGPAVSRLRGHPQERHHHPSQALVPEVIDGRCAPRGSRLFFCDRQQPAGLPDRRSGAARRATPARRSYHERGTSPSTTSPMPIRIRSAHPAESWSRSHP